MEQYFNHMKMGMQKTLQSDTQVSQTAFAPDFPQSVFIDYILDNILLLLIKDAENCTVLTGIIRRVIYRYTAAARFFAILIGAIVSAGP